MENKIANSEIVQIKLGLKESPEIYLIECDETEQTQLNSNDIN